MAKPFLATKPLGQHQGKGHQAALFLDLLVFSLGFSCCIMLLLQQLKLVPDVPVVQIINDNKGLGGLGPKQLQCSSLSSLLLFKNVF